MFPLTKNRSIALQAVLIVIAYGLQKALGYAPVTVAVMLLATAVRARILKKAIAAARYRIIGIDALVTIAVIGALAIGEYWEAAAVTFLFSFGAYLEARTIERPGPPSKPFWISLPRAP